DLGTLPVELVSFTASRRQHLIELNWRTAMEKDNDYFAVEVSHDGRNFRETARVKGAGNSQQARSYSFTYRPAGSGLLYFRLRQADLDGQVTFSPIVAVSGNPAPEVFLQAYPNPGSGLYLLEIPAGEEEVLAGVCDLAGKQILPLQILRRSGKPASLDLRAQAPGIYLLTLVRGKSRQVIRLVKN
ncbi:MAG: T9SS type A sorting domain-containing protein, partial [Adhaeribacter sp.]